MVKPMKTKPYFLTRFSFKSAQSISSLGEEGEESREKRANASARETRSYLFRIRFQVSRSSCFSSLYLDFIVLYFLRNHRASSSYKSGVIACLVYISRFRAQITSRVELPSRSLLGQTSLSSSRKQSEA